MTTGPQNAVPFGKYLLLKRLAVGGMAELYLAKAPGSEALVVIKRILPYLAEETEFVRMFLDEARIAAQLHHPHIIQLHELGQLEGSIFIAMEFVEGVDLRRILQQEQKRSSVVPPDVAAWLTARLCEGLHYAHNKDGADGRPLGIIHRDVSPQNLMVGYRGEVKLVDFGIAKATSFMERSKPGVIKGKFLYLSPEQLSQDRLDHRADLFALGTMIYEVTTGKSPFYKPTTEAVIYAIRAEDPPPPQLLVKGYPAELSRIIMRCLVKDRTRRYQQAGEVRADLEEWMRKEAPMTMAGAVDYVDKLFGDQEERTALFIPPNARGVPIDGPATRRTSPDNISTAQALGAMPDGTNSNPTVSLGPLKPIQDETTKPLLGVLIEDAVPPSIGRRPTPASGSMVSADDQNPTQTVRPADIVRALTRPSPAVQVPSVLERKVSGLLPTTISAGARLNTGDPRIDLAPNGPDSVMTPTVPPTPQAPPRRSRDFQLPNPKTAAPVPSHLSEEGPTSGARPSNIRGGQATDPTVPPEPRARPVQSFADADDAVSTMDFRSGSVAEASPRRSSRVLAAGDGLLVRKPWLIAVFAFLAVLILGLLLILWARPQRKPRAVDPVADESSKPVPAEEIPPEAPTEITDSGKTVVRFAAPAGTVITHGDTSFVPHKAYPLFPGSFSVTYRCPRKGRRPGDVINASVIVEQNRNGQVIPLSCR